MQRRLIGKRESLVGLGAGMATILGCASILLLLGLIPSDASRGFFGASYQHPLSGWLVDAFLAPFWGLTTRHQQWGPGLPTDTLRFAGASLGALLVFVGVLWAVGWQVRQRVQPAPRLRIGALLVAALTAACVVAVAAAVLGHTLQTVETDHSISPGGPVAYDPLSYFFGVFALTMLLGVFCFGVIGMLPQPWEAALRRAGALVGACFLIGGLSFPAFVVSDNLPDAKVAHDFGLASAYSSSIGGLTIPLALQAPVSLEQWWSSPWINYNTTTAEDHLHWYDLAYSTALDHPRGRLFQHAASLGLVGSLVGAALTLAVLCALVLSTWRLCRDVALETASRGLRLGLAQGAAIISLLAVTLWLSSLYSSFNSSVTYWGIVAFGFAQCTVTVLLACGLVGLAYGAKEARRREAVSTNLQDS